MTDKKDDKSNVVQFLNREGNKFFPPTVRIKAVIFYGPAIKQLSGEHVSPCVSHIFEVPVTEEQALKAIEGHINRGGIVGKIDDGFVFIPWPCAAIFFEVVDFSAGDPPA